MTDGIRSKSPFIPIKRYWAILSKYLMNRRGQFALLSFLVLSSICMQVVNPQIMRSFIDNALAGSPTRALLWTATLFMAVALFQQAIAVAAGFLGENVAWHATNGLRADLARHTLGLDMAFHNDKSPGEFIERIEGDVSEFSGFFSQLVLKVAGNLLLLLGILIALFRENRQVGLVFTLFAVVTLTALHAIRHIAVPHQKALRDAQTDLFGFLEERLAGTEDIRSSGAVDFVVSRLFKLQTIVLNLWRTAAQKQFLVRITAGLMLSSGYVVAFVMGYRLYGEGILSLGTVYLIIHYTGLLARPIRELTQQVESLQNIGACVERMSELLNVKSSIADPLSGPPLPGGALGLSFEQVSFGYHPNGKTLKALSFEVGPGRIVGLLGRTGSGKTTIARLIFRLYEHGEGSIRLAGEDIRKITLKELRHRVAFVTQEVQLFQASVRDNLTFFDESIPDERLLRVIDELGLKDWFLRLPNGLDTRLQTGGRGLSAGEAQLLAFTRVFLRDPGLVILDEASSRLDPATEMLVEKAIDRLLRGRSAIIIAHRLGTLRRADEVLILEEGAAVEQGIRTKLLANPASRFAQLHRTGLQEILV